MGAGSVAANEHLLHSMLVSTFIECSHAELRAVFYHPFGLAAARCVVLVHETGPATPSPRLLSARVIALLPRPLLILFHGHSSPEYRPPYPPKPPLTHPIRSLEVLFGRRNHADIRLIFLWDSRSPKNYGVFLSSLPSQEPRPWL